MTDYSQFAKLTPFELKDELIKLASTKTDVPSAMFVISLACLPPNFYTRW